MGKKKASKKNKAKKSNNIQNEIKDEEIVDVEEVETFENTEEVNENSIENNEPEEYIINDYEVINKKRMFPIVMIIIAIVFIISLSIFTVMNKVNKNVYTNVYLQGKNLSNMNSKEVQAVITEMSKKYNDEVKIDIVQGNKVINTVTQDDIDFKVDIEKTYKKVFDFGRNSNLLVNNYNILKNLFIKTNLELEYTYDKQKLLELSEIISSAVENKVVDDSFEVDEETHKLILTKGKEGNTIDSKLFEQEIVDLLKTNKNSEYTAKLVKAKPKNLNVDEVYTAIKRDAKDAEVIETPGKKPVFKKEIYGHDIDKEVLSNLIETLDTKNPSETLEVPLKVIEPKVKYQDIAWTKFEDVLGSLTTRFPASNKARATNLSIALAKLNGIVLMPGEVFSFNKVIGDPNAAKGYKPAATFKGSQVVDEVGGGICQTVSTLYNAVLYANLDVVSRKAHGLAVGYVRPSLDATMYYPNIDFKFKNTRSYPIKIKTTFSWNGNMSVSILGTKEDVEYKIELSSKIISKKPFETVTEIDPNMAPGTEKVKHNGVQGYTSEAYKITKLNGKVIKTELLSRDTYKPTTKVIVKGPEVIAPAPNTQPTPLPSVPEGNLPEEALPDDEFIE